MAKHWKANETEAVETGDDFFYLLTANYSSFFLNYCWFRIAQPKSGPVYTQMMDELSMIRLPATLLGHNIVRCSRAGEIGHQWI